MQGDAVVRARKADCMDMPSTAKGWSKQSSQSEGSSVKGGETQVARHCLWMVPETHLFIIRVRSTCLT